MSMTLNSTLLIQLLSVASGAALGAMARFAITSFIVSGAWGIFTVNVVGSFGFGLALGALIASSPNAKLFWLTGFLGALTTFSSYIFEIHHFATPTVQWKALLFFVVGQHVLGILFFILGLWLAKNTF